MAVEETVHEKEMIDEKGRSEADGILETSPDDLFEETDEVNNEDDQQATRKTEKLLIGKNNKTR